MNSQNTDLFEQYPREGVSDVAAESRARSVYWRTAASCVLVLVLASFAASALADRVCAAGAGVSVRFSVTVPTPPADYISVTAEYSNVGSPLVVDLGLHPYLPAVADTIAGLTFVTGTRMQIPYTTVDPGAVRVVLPAGETAVSATYSLNLAGISERHTALEEIGVKLTGYGSFLLPQGQKVASVKVQVDVPESWEVVSIYPYDGEWFTVEPVAYRDLALETKSGGWLAGIIDFDHTKTYEDGFQLRLVGFRGAPWRHWNLDSGGTPLGAALLAADFYHDMYVAVKDIFGGYPYRRQLLTGPGEMYAGSSQAMTPLEGPWQYNSYVHHIIHCFIGPASFGGKPISGPFINALNEGYTTYCEGYLTSQLTGDPISRGMLYERKINYLRGGHFNNLDQETNSYVYGVIRTCAIDQEISKRTGGTKGIHDLMARLWQKYRTSSSPWITSSDILGTLRELTGSDWTAFYSRVIDSDSADPSSLDPLRDDFDEFLHAISERWFYGHPSAYFVSQEIVSAVGNFSFGTRFQDPTRLVSGPSIGHFAVEARKRFDLSDPLITLTEEDVEEILHSLTGKDHGDFFEFYRGLGFEVDPSDITEFARAYDGGITCWDNQMVRATPRTAIAGMPTKIRLDVLDQDFAKCDELILQVGLYVDLPDGQMPTWVSGMATGPDVAFAGADQVDRAQFGSMTQAFFEVPILSEMDGSSQSRYTEFTLQIPAETPLTDIALNGRFRDRPSSSEYLGTDRVHYNDHMFIDIVPRRFTDLDPGNLFLSEIDYLASKRILSGGEGLCRPSDEITRAELAEWLVNASGAPMDVPDPGFSDVASVHPKYGYIAAARAAGIILGYPDSTFGPDRPVTRAEMAAMIVRAFGLPLPTGDGGDFTDVPPNLGLAPEIAAMAAAGIAKGYPDGTFHPEQHTPRDQAAAFVSRACRRTAPWAMVGRQP